MEVRLYVQKICYQLWAQLHQVVGPPGTISCEHLNEQHFDKNHHLAQLGISTKSYFDVHDWTQINRLLISCCSK